MLERMFTDNPADPLKYLSHCLEFARNGGDVRRFDFIHAAQLSARLRKESEAEEVRSVRKELEEVLNQSTRKELQYLEKVKDMKMQLALVRAEADSLRVQLDASKVIAESATAALDSRGKIKANTKRTTRTFDFKVQRFNERDYFPVGSCVFASLRGEYLPGRVCAIRNNGTQRTYDVKFNTGEVVVGIMESNVKEMREKEIRRMQMNEMRRQNARMHVEELRKRQEMALAELQQQEEQGAMKENEETQELERTKIITEVAQPIKPMEARTMKKDEATERMELKITTKDQAIKTAVDTPCTFDLDKVTIKTADTPSNFDLNQVPPVKRTIRVNRLYRRRKLKPSTPATMNNVALREKMIKTAKTIHRRNIVLAAERRRKSKTASQHINPEEKQERQEKSFWAVVGSEEQEREKEKNLAFLGRI
eukprot:g1894.t1